MKSIFSSLVILVFLFTSCTTVKMRSHDHKAGKRKFTKHFDDSLFEITEKGFFSVEIVTDRKDLKIDEGMVGFIIHNAHDEDVEGANLKVFLWIPELGQNMLTIMEKGRGLYSAENINLNRNGKWELRIDIKKDNEEDSAIFVFPDGKKAKMPHGEYEPKTIK